ncbi:MAG: 16S rRNA (cytosine(967)-C(5))-methyltransferase RsmB [Acidobacteria bacterium]|nr:16S rRNA (cytosine(967)-C(5))-methyltransferase RsmB [Acidobacteriota bacterium]
MGSQPRKPSPARKAAFEILLRVETQSSYAAELLHSQYTASLSARDAALCTELVLGTLRWRGMLDFLVQQLARMPWDSLDPEVKVALRMGLYQLRFLSRMPSRAAVYETVELVKAAGKRSASGMVNAVLRRGAQADLASFRPPAMPELEWQSIELSHPAWLLERWAARYGRLAAISLASANNQPPKTSFRLRTNGQSPSEIENQLREIAVEIGPGNFLKNCWVLRKGNIVRTEPYRRGELIVQDEASQIVPYLLDVRDGHGVLDLCAAPGNKTAQLAQWAGNTGRVVACDAYLHRLREMPVPGQDNVWRVALDGRQPLPFSNPFDRVLVDAPCSGTGTLRRDPEIKWRLSLEDIRELSETQSQLLSKAAGILATGGRMVYSTCALEKEENEMVVRRFLENHPNFSLLPVQSEKVRLRDFLQPSALWILEGDFLATFPPRDGTDGFFAAILIKTDGKTHSSNGKISGNI